MVKLKEQPHEEDGEDDDKCLEIKRTAGGKQLTFQGAVALAIRRNFGNAATADVGMMLLENISRYSVSRAETRTGTALIASSKLWFHAIYQDLASLSGESGFTVCFNSYRQDATNSGILKGSKLGALILHSGFLRKPLGGDVGRDGKALTGDDVDLGSVDSRFDIDDWFECRVRVADVLPVQSGTSESTVGQTLKQLDGLGCLHWKAVHSDNVLQKHLGFELKRELDSTLDLLKRPLVL